MILIGNGLHVGKSFPVITMTTNITKQEKRKIMESKTISLNILYAGALNFIYGI